MSATGNKVVAASCLGVTMWDVRTPAQPINEYRFPDMSKSAVKAISQAGFSLSQHAGAFPTVHASPGVLAVHARAHMYLWCRPRPSPSPSYSDGGGGGGGGGVIKVQHLMGADNVATVTGAGQTIATTDAGAGICLWDAGADPDSYDAASFYGGVCRRSQLAQRPTHSRRTQQPRDVQLGVAIAAAVVNDNMVQIWDRQQSVVEPCSDGPHLNLLCCFISTGNLLENTDGGAPTPLSVFSRGSSLLPPSLC